MIDDKDDRIDDNDLEKMYQSKTYSQMRYGYQLSKNKTAISMNVYHTKSETVAVERLKWKENETWRQKIASKKLSFRRQDPLAGAERVHQTIST